MKNKNWDYFNLIENIKHWSWNVSIWFHFQQDCSFYIFHFLLLVAREIDKKFVLNSCKMSFSWNYLFRDPPPSYTLHKNGFFRKLINDFLTNSGSCSFTQRKNYIGHVKNCFLYTHTNSITQDIFRRQCYLIHFGIKTVFFSFFCYGWREIFFC